MTSRSDRLVVPGLTPRRKRALSVTAFVGVVGFLVAGAVLYPGFRSAEVELNDGGVWVVSKSKNAVGRLNYPSRVLDGAVTPASTSFDVLQSGGDVFVDDGSGSTLNQVSSAQMSLGGDQQLPSSSSVSFGSDVLSVSDAVSGKVWAVRASSVSGFDEESSEPVVEASAGVVSVVGVDDSVYSVDPGAGSVTRTVVDGSGVVVSSDVQVWDALKGVSDVQVSVVGDSPVVFEALTGRLFLAGGRVVDVPQGRDGKLQGAGPESGFVAVGTTRALVKVSLDGSGVVSVGFGGEGVPAAPVQLGGCVHGAWSGANKYVRDCGDDADDKSVDVPKASASPSYVFRVNRDVVVLNDVNSGNVWLVNQNMQLVNNWDEVIPPKNQSDDQDEESADDNFINVLPDRTKPNRPPETTPDSLGVRPGRTTVLSVLDNDSDPDGDVLTAGLSGNPPADGKVESIYGGTAFQVSVPAEAEPGTENFGYTASDGRGLSAEGRIELTVVGPDENRAPQFKRGSENTTVLVEQGKTVSQNILTDWVDPDGDDLVLLDATADNPQDQVKIRRDGLLTFQDSGATAGKKNVSVTIWDGRDTVTGEVVVNVQPPGALAPVVNADHVTAVVGQDLVIAPLKNDVDPNGGALRLAQVEANGPAEVGPVTDGGTFTFRSTVPGPVYLTYIASNGPQSTQGLIRVDVESGTDGGDPVAVHDVALLPVGGSVLLDPLANDSDPSGGVLVLQSVNLKGNTSASVSVIDHSVIRITDLLSASEPFLFDYTMSNGTTSATGSVSVVPVPAPSVLEAPQPKPDDVNVRVNDVVTIPVLENDTHPQGQELSLDPVLPQSVDPADGTVFVSENTVRFIAGAQPKTVRAIYNAVDPQGQKSAAAITINILPLEGAENTRPQPQNLTARVVAAGTVRIPVPLDGIDPDGDSVQLTGIDSSPAKGTATVGSNFIDFTAAGNGAGTDTFRYRVVDRQGAVNTGTVTVGIAPRGEANQNPTPVDDEIRVRPGRAVAVDAVANDTDPDGDPIRLLADGIEADPALQATVSSQSGRILLQSPDVEGTVNLRYSIADDRDASAQASIRVTVDSQVPLQAPIARDDRVTSAQTLGKTAVEVPVLKNDEDPDGVGENLLVSTSSTTARPGADGSMVVELTEGPQLIPYSVEDVDGQQSTAIIWVPGLGQQVPTLAKNDSVEVIAGQSTTINLAEWVKVRDGRSPRVTQADSVTVIGGDGSDPVSSSATDLTYAAGLDYVGPGSISFEVTDGSGPDDPGGLKSTLSIRTKVLPDPNKNNPPELLGAALSVARGEASQLDLRTLVSDPDQDDVDKMSYELQGESPAGFDVRMDGSLLRVSVPDDTATGTAASIQVRAKDPRGLESTATFALGATASNRPNPVANDDVETDAAAGKPVAVDVLANDVNPFPESPLKIITAAAETGQGSVEVSGGTITVTPAGGFTGTLVVAYTVQDKLGEPSRQSTARVRLTVKDKPLAPGTPQAQSVGDRTALLTWTAPADRGDPISTYTVYGEGGFRQECPANTCTLSNLVNNTTYQFQVTATNKFGESDRSAASAEVRPDVKPDTPGAPKLAFGDRQISVTWAAPASKGSPITSYDLEISPAPASQNAQIQNLTAATHVWKGLQNGVAYKVRVLARNDAKEPSEWSPYSAAEVPAAAPATPAAPSASAATSVGNQSQLKVNWAAPNDNGDPVSAYALTTYRGGAAVSTSQVSGTTQNVTVDNSEADYTFTVTATNKAGTSPASPQSAAIRAVGKPAMLDQPSAELVETGGDGGKIQVSFSPLTPAQRNGSSAAEITYMYRLTSGGGSGSIAVGGGVVSAVNGTDTGVVVWGVSSRSSKAGDASPASNAVNPYGLAAAPAVNGSKSNGVGDKTVSWTWNQPNGNGRAVAGYQYRFDGGNWQGTQERSFSKSVGFGEVHTLEVRAMSADQPGRIGSDTSRSGAEPPPPAPTSWDIRATPYRTCTEPSSSTDSFGGPTVCRAPGKWFNTGSTEQADYYVVWRKSSDNPTGVWYHLTTGSAAGNFARSDTTSLGGTPPGGMPGR
ncbi:Ig-like domain-containing protein [Pseudarthrobacter sp. PS3-L1]|uniref:Ig-like domain-containing protein n=1 Tax=Pseudarthrobacter sp. PS3-L1 TaxID=3046207 RepID=UPI0024BB8847|nr:Ig-like domain-containing protein [Pseudarthrobacter sp. PS3-L1]MDJ0319702.1 Ig-like domain-containing protein [Pseudarthrobacter sp. PS3-L1]